jgi:hypothetical protein
MKSVKSKVGLTPPFIEIPPYHALYIYRPPGWHKKYSNIRGGHICVIYLVGKGRGICVVYIVETSWGKIYILVILN